MRVLYICTHNRCRSIMAEAITRQIAGQIIVARSAGSRPEGRVHPQALNALQGAGYNTEGLRSKSWDELADYNPDLIITLCDSAAGEPCPLWFEDCQRWHWGLTDPSRIHDDEATVAAAFSATIKELEELVGRLIEGPTDL